MIPHLEEGTAIDDAYYEFEEEVKEGELQDFAKDQTYPIDLLKKLVNEYEYSGQLDNNLVEEACLVDCLYVLRRLIMLNHSFKKPLKVWSRKLTTIKIL